MHECKELISPNIFFTHIMKTGGTTLGQFLGLHYDLKYITPHGIHGDLIRKFNLSKNQAKAEGYFSQHYLKYRLFTGSHFPVQYISYLNKYYGNFKTIVIFRKPVDRLISQVNHHARVPEYYFPELHEKHANNLMMARNMTVVEFLRQQNKGSIAYNTQSNIITGWKYKHAPEDELYDAALEAVAGIDYVGITESLGRFIEYLSKTIGWAPPKSIEKLNVNPVNDVTLSGEEKLELEQYVSVDEKLYKEAMTIFENRSARINKRSYLIPEFRPGPYFEYTMDQPLVGEGWHEREKTENGYARWIGPRPTATIYFPLTEGLCYTLKLFICSVVNSDVLESLSILLNGKILDHKIAHGDGMIIVEAKSKEICSPLNDEFNGLSEIKVSSSRTYTVKELYDVEDTRSKTIAVEKIEIRPY